MKVVRECKCYIICCLVNLVLVPPLILSSQRNEASPRKAGKCDLCIRALDWKLVPRSGSQISATSTPPSRKHQAKRCRDCGWAHDILQQWMSFKVSIFPFSRNISTFPSLASSEPIPHSEISGFQHHREHGAHWVVGLIPGRRPSKSLSLAGHILRRHRSPFEAFELC